MATALKAEYPAGEAFEPSEKIVNFFVLRNGKSRVCPKSTNLRHSKG